jgi:fatty-acyl-CoA synthase/long-chain acyl-CoA synthetase
VLAIHAARKLGATAVPLSHRLTPEEAAHVVDHSDASVCCVDAELVGLFAALRPRAPRVREILVFGGPPGPGMRSADSLLAAADPGEPPPLPADFVPRLMTYTSGTTGRPKGAVREAPGNPQQLQGLLAAVGAVPEDVYLTTGPLYHSGPGGWLSVAHMLGNTAVLLRRFDPEEWLRLVAKHRVSCTTCAPTPMRRITGLPEDVKARYDRSSIRYVIGSAAAWPFELKRAYVRDFGDRSLFEMYGSTELGATTLLFPEDQLRKPGSCGRPAPGVEIALFDEAGREITEPGVPGEVYARSAGAFTGYHKDPAAFQAASRGAFRSVGDVAFRDHEGFYYLCDRKVDMVVSGGVNVYPAEVEAVLERHPGVAEAAVFGIPSEEWGESVHAVIVPRAGHAPTAAEITAFARQHLAGYKLPRSLELRDALPRNELGKLLKRVLREPYWSSAPRPPAPAGEGSLHPAPEPPADER